MSGFIKRMLLFVLVLLVSFPAMAFGKEPKVATDFWPPFRISDKDGAMSGIDIDLMELVGKRMGVDFTIERFPWGRCLKYMEKGTSDFMTGVAKTPERQKYLLYSEIPYFSCRPSFYSRKGQGIDIQEYGDLKRLRIGYTRNSAYFPQFDEDSSLMKYDATTEKQLIEMLVAGRLDVIIGTDCQVDYDISQQGLNDVIEKEPYIPDHSVDLYIVISKESRWKYAMGKLNRVLQDLLKEGEVDHIARKYLKNRSDSSVTDQ